jgi:ribosome-associated translation inhibitor RaiA
VAVGYTHQHHQQGNIPRIRVEMAVHSSHELVVSHEPNHMEEKDADADVANALSEAVKDAERKLRNHKEEIRDKERTPKESGL